MDQIFYASVVTYRVVVSHNPENPDIFYIDMCRDGFCAHDWLLKMQKKFYHNEKLERVFNDSKGIFLKEYCANGNISLIYTKHRDVMAQQYQAQLRQKIDPEIIRVFKQMKAEGKMQTISVQTEKFYYADDKKVLSLKPRSIYQENMLAEISRQKKIEKLKAVKQAYYAQKKYAANPHILLQWKQAMYRGD